MDDYLGMTVNDCYPHNALRIVLYAVVQCPFVCLSVSRWYYPKTAEPRMMGVFMM